MPKEVNNSIKELEVKEHEDWIKICKQCGMVIERTTKIRTKIFCSSKCCQLWWNSHLDQVKRKAFYHKTCFHCERPFVVYGAMSAKFCSRACYLSWIHIRKVTLIAQKRIISPFIDRGEDNE